MNVEGVGKLDMMVVGSDEEARALLCSLLELLGARRIRQASMGQEATTYLRLYPAEIVFCFWDVEMPGLIDFIRDVRASDDDYRYAVIIATGDAESESMREAYDAGVSDLLVDPDTVRSLARVLRESVENFRKFVSIDDYFGPCRRRVQLNSYGGNDRRSVPPAFIMPPYFEKFQNIASGRTAGGDETSMPSDQRLMAIRAAAEVATAKDPPTDPAHHALMAIIPTLDDGPIRESPEMNPERRLEELRSMAAARDRDDPPKP
ncbi:MAG: response regulator [Alphaproteobacteria bacterium]